MGNHATQNVLAVGMPVCDASGDVLAGISVAAAENRMPRERQRRVVQAHAQKPARPWFRRVLSGRRGDLTLFGQQVLQGLDLQAQALVLGLQAR